MMRATLYVSSFVSITFFPMLYLHTIKQTLQPINFPFWSSVIWKSNIITKNIILYGIGTYKHTKHQENEILCSSIKTQIQCFFSSVLFIFHFTYPYFVMFSFLLLFVFFFLFQNKLNKNISNINAQKKIQKYDP